MHRPLRPITELLIREIREVRTLIKDVQEKIERTDPEEVIKEGENIKPKI